MSKKLTKEEEILLQDFSRNVSTKSNALFYGNGFIVSAIPITLFWRIHQIDIYTNWAIFGLVVLACSYMIAFAYKNVKFVLKHKISQAREDAVNRELQMSETGTDKRALRKEREERALWKKNEVADFEATTFSIFYNNSIFLLVLVFTSFYLLRTFNPIFNFIASMGIASGFVALLSTGSPNKQ